MAGATTFQRGIFNCSASARTGSDRLGGLPRFGLEVFMNRLWLDEVRGIDVVPRPGVAGPMKAEKRGGFVPRGKG